jgi:RNA polymerase sigma-70 factor (ECF subfamily)
MSTATDAPPLVADVVTDRVLASAALAAVAPPARRLLALQHLAGWTQAEVAERTGVAVGTVKSASSRAVARIRAEHR